MFGRVEKGEERNWKRDFGEENGMLGWLGERKWGSKQVLNLWDPTFSNPPNFGKKRENIWQNK